MTIDGVLFCVSGSPRLMRWLRKARPAVLGALAVVAALSVTRGLAQESEDIAADIDRYRGILAVAQQKLTDLELPEALARFTEIIDGYQAGRLSATNPLTHGIVGNALDGRARTLANLARTAEAEADFEALIRFDSAWPVDREQTSPKVIALYDKVRKRIVGTLTIQAEPPGALVILDGEAVGRAPMFDRDLMAGGHKLRIEAPGYEPIGEEIVVHGAEKVARSYTLIRNSRDLLVVTAPPGCRVSISGAERGTTFGVAGAEYAAAAGTLGLTVNDLSAPLLLERLPPGEHLVKVEKECHEPQLLKIQVALDPADPSAMRMQPIRLLPSLGSIRVESSPSGAEVLIDGQPGGKTPLKKDGLCSGRHQVTVRLDDTGQWIGSVDVTSGASATVSAVIRMTLAFVGIAAEGPGAEQAREDEKKIYAGLSSMKMYNALAPESGSTGADLVIAGRPGAGAFERTVDLTITAARFPALSMRIAVPLGSTESIREALKPLEVRSSLTSAWLGMQVIDTHRSGAVVLSVAAEGPAARAGAIPNEAITSLGGVAIKSAQDLARSLAALKPGSQASLVVQTPGKPPRHLSVTLAATPLIDPSAGPMQFAPLRAAEMAFRARVERGSGRPSSAERTSALLNLAMILLKAEQFEAAIVEALRPVDTTLGGGGVGAGTVAYLKGVCLNRMGQPQQAKTELERAAENKTATLWTNDGPPVSERARRILSSM